MTGTHAPSPDAASAPVTGIRALAQRPFVSAAAGGAAFPLTVLFFLFFFDEFDTAAFGVLGPKIKHAFHLSTQGFTFLVVINLVVLLVLSIPVGYYGDRLPRTRIVTVSAIVAGAFSLLTGIAPVLWVLVVARLGNGLGLLANDPIHRSLLADFYPPDARPRVFAFHANAARYGAIVGSIVAGLIALVFGWRAAFCVLIVPIVAMAFVSLKLRNPIRGETDDPASALIAAEERAVPFGRGVRILLGVRTLRTQYAAWVAIGAAYIPLLAYVPIYYDEVFHLNPFEIGVLGGVGTFLALIAVHYGGRWTNGWLAKGMGEPAKWAGISLLGVGPCLAVVALAPNLWIAVPGVLGAYFVGGFFTPAFLTTQALVSPARVRSLSFSFGSLFIAAGATFFVLAFGQFANDNIRTGIAALVPFWLIGGLILWSAKRFVADDTKRAFDILHTTAEMRRARLDVASRSILSVRNLDVSYGPVQVLFGVNLELAEGEMIALLGTNGAGKSTLLKAICGLVPMQSGSIFFDGDDISGLEPEDSFAEGLVQVPGGRGIFPGLTVKENLDVAYWATRRPKANARAAVDEMLDTFPNLARRVDAPASVLSGGEQQMLTLAQAFISRPKLLMIDELSLGLAPVVVESLLEIVRGVHAAGTSVVLVEQSVNVALTVATRAAFMEKGEVRFTGPTAELLERDDILRAVFLGGAAAAEGMFT